MLNLLQDQLKHYLKHYPGVVKEICKAVSLMSTGERINEEQGKDFHSVLLEGL
jgi:ABC-type methionine transport system ATPase subunit